MQPTTQLLRQVHPHFYKEGRLLSIAFRPNENDRGLLSVYDGDLILPKAAHQHYTTQLDKQSVGVWAVTVGEAADLALPARPDVEGFFPEHAVVDFTAHGPKDQAKKAKVLAAKAEKRGCLFRAEVP